MAEDFSEEAIYEAIRNYRVYATEDRNLEIGYTVNDLPMGTIIETVPQTLKFNISLMDPDGTDATAKVELVVNSGKVAHTWDNAEELATGVLTVELEPEYSYYFLRVTQADKDIAVTAPVWVGESLKVGLREVTADILTPVVGEEVTISTTLYNEEASDAVIKSMIYTLNGSQVLHADASSRVLGALSAETLEWKYTPGEAKISTITVTVVLEYEGKDYTFTATVELDVMSDDEMTYLAIDASHNNEYVTGYNKDLLNNFITMANEAGIRVELLTSSEAFVAACKSDKFSAILLNPPSRRLSEAKVYSEAELEALKLCHENGGNVILTGLGDSNDKLEPHVAATQNALLTAMGSSLRLSDDGTYEDNNYGLTFDTFGDNDFTKGLTMGVSFYGGSSIFVADENGNPVTDIPDTVYPILYGNQNTISKDGDSDGKGGESTPVYGLDRLMVMAAEQQEGKGLIFLAGAPFMNDYDLKLPGENGNNALVEMIFKAIRTVKVTEIAEVRKETEEGYKFTIEGVVTSNASGYDKETAFFDCIYVQDETAGINCFPVAGDYRIGDVLRVSGTTDFYQGEPELQVMTVEKLGETQPVYPTNITAAQLNDRTKEGSLVKVSGQVTEIVVANGLVESIYIQDETGIARIFIDGYITANKSITNLEKGCTLSAVGIASYDDTYAISHDSYSRLRVRDRGDILVVAPPTEEPVELPFEDVTEGLWYYDAVEYVYTNELMIGTSDTAFKPDSNLTRGMLVTILYRMAGEPETETTVPFEDVEPGLWYSEAVAWGYENEIVRGVEENAFAPNQDVTREQMVTFLYRFAKYMGADVSDSAELNAFADGDTVSGFAVDAMSWAIAEGIINGLSNHMLKPLDTATRAQVAAVIMRFDRMMQ